MSGKVTAGEDGDAQVFVRDQCNNAHHGGSALIQFNGTFAQLGLFIILVPSKVEGTIAVISDEFGCRIRPFGIPVHNGSHRKKEEHLKCDELSIFRGQKGRNRRQTIGNIFGTGESNTGRRYQVSGHRQHGNTSVRNFTFTKQVEFGLIAIRNNAQGIPQTKLQKANMQIVVVRQDTSIPQSTKYFTLQIHTGAWTPKASAKGLACKADDDLEVVEAGAKAAAEAKEAERARAVFIILIDFVII